MFEVFFGFVDDYAAQSEEGDKVRDCHESVDDVGKYPDFVEFEEYGRCYHDDEDEAIEFDRFGTEEVVAATFTVVVPAECGGEGEED